MHSCHLILTIRVKTHHFMGIKAGMKAATHIQSRVGKNECMHTLCSAHSHQVQGPKLGDGAAYSGLSHIHLQSVQSSTDYRLVFSGQSLRVSPQVTGGCGELINTEPSQHFPEEEAAMFIVNPLAVSCSSSQARREVPGVKL